MKVFFVSEALDEFRGAVQYSERNFGLGEEFVQEVESAIRKITSDPQRFKFVAQGYQICRLRSVPYYLIYHHSAKAGAVQIFAISHNHRQPGYWMKRLPRS